MSRLADQLQLQLAQRVLGLPPTLLDVLLATRRKTYRSATLDPTAHLMFGLFKRSGRAGLHEMEPPRARQAFATLGGPFEVEHVEVPIADTTLAELPVRLYRGGSADAPAMLFFHGGGFVVGSIQTYDRVCRYIAKASRATVVSVEYRLAPEHPYPAAHLDARRVLDAALAGAPAIGEPSAWMVAGDSAGGNLAASAAQHAQEVGAPLSFQYLVYPATDLLHETQSFRDLPSMDLLLGSDLLEWFGRHLVDDRERVRDPMASPLRRDDLTGLCATKIVTAGFDPLWDEGEAYAKRLREAKVDVAHQHYPTMFHGFMSFAALFPEGRALLEDMARTLRDL